MSTETNCFRISGLEALRINYRLFQIVGLRRDGMDYYGNIQKIIRQLSFQMKAPVTTYERGSETFVLVPQGYGDPPNQIMLVGSVATLRETNEMLDLSFDSNSFELDPIRMRFLQFSIQDPLFRDTKLWQPGAGKPFFFKRPDKALGDLELFEGFTLRAVPHPEGGFGVTVDLRRKLVARSPLSSSITREEINKLKGRSCVYKMGDNWYEISLSGLSDLKVGDPSIPLEGKAVSLADYLHTKSTKPVPSSIAMLSPDGAAIYYRTNGPGQLSAPAVLCHLVEDTHGAAGARNQPQTIIDPSDRHRQINRVVRMFLGSLKIGRVEAKVAEHAGCAKGKPLPVPTLLFGNNKKLALRSGGNDADALREYGRQRLRLLDDSCAGFFEQSPLARQHLVIPKSIYNSCGPRFLLDLQAQMKSLYPSGGAYDPEVIVYDDLNGSRNFVGQSRAIRAAMEAANVRPGFALVMVHRGERLARSADQLAAWTVKEFNLRFQITAAVIHTDVVKRGYVAQRRDGGNQYTIKDAEQRRVRGYIRNVAINKILLTNGKWPFVLDTKLYADVVIGIDVKNSTAAFTLIAGGGRIIRFSTSPSRQKEQLLKNQVTQYVADLIRKERMNFEGAPAEIVIHRDGRAWPSEIEGVREACRQLAQEGVVANDWHLTVLEISKSAPAPMRMFNVRSASSGTVVENPVVGSWINVDRNEGFVCTTGSPFAIPGTANPLHIKRVDGAMPMEECLGDVFDLSCLTWGRPEGVMRVPISIKLCDRSLYEEAEEVNEDEVEFGNDNFSEAAR